jgi:hypothetical protein
VLWEGVLCGHFLGDGSECLGRLWVVDVGLEGARGLEE